MEKREFYRKKLPHFQQPGQAYFVTWCLINAVPPKAMERYSLTLNQIKFELEFAKTHHVDEGEINDLKQKYKNYRQQYIKAFDDLLHIQNDHLIDLSTKENTQTVINTLQFWEGKRLENHAICVMPNHVHWVFKTLEKDEQGKAVYLQDILQSVKRFSANELNNTEKRKGSVWQSESFDTTIRDPKHLYNAINYTINNPVKARFVKNWDDWDGTLLFI